MFRFFRWLFNCPRCEIIATRGCFFVTLDYRGNVIRRWKAAFALLRTEFGEQRATITDGASTYPINPIYVREYLMDDDADDDKNNDDPVEQPDPPPETPEKKPSPIPDRGWKCTHPSRK